MTIRPRTCIEEIRNGCAEQIMHINATNREIRNVKFSSMHYNRRNVDLAPLSCRFENISILHGNFSTFNEDRFG